VPPVLPEFKARKASPALPGPPVPLALKVHRGSQVLKVLQVPLDQKVPKDPPDP